MKFGLRIIIEEIVSPEGDARLSNSTSDGELALVGTFGVLVALESLGKT